MLNTFDKTATMPQDKPRLLIRKKDAIGTVAHGMFRTGDAGRYATDGSMAILTAYWPKHENETIYRFKGTGQPESAPQRDKTIDDIIDGFPSVRSAPMPALVPSRLVIDADDNVTHVIVEDGSKEYGFKIRYWLFIHNTLGLVIRSRHDGVMIRKAPYPICTTDGAIVGVIMPFNLDLSADIWDSQIVNIDG